MMMEHGRHFQHWSRKGEPLHFYGANGFPVGCYQGVLEQLAEQFAVSSLFNRATWPATRMPKSFDWQIYADDLIHFLEHHITKPVIGVGHSLGATATIYAAIKRPDLFSRLVLIEPAMASPWLARILRVAPFKLKRRIQPIKYTVAKPEHWQSKQTFYDDCRSRRVFKRIDDHNLQLLAQHSLIEDEENAYRLTFPKLWEARNYASAPNLYKTLGQLQVPVSAIRGKPSLYFSQKSWQVWQRVSPHSIFLENLNYGHLIPLESPNECARLMLSGIEQSREQVRLSE
ncbi:alpha/beta hydrolase [Thalassotalea sp. LPB0316]|uniref:alpha/beta fold hydrolase n=1 Tax=Thalassotalea sp. LPB0316 TaxID=2769490 RepID=UPI0018676DE9|nr:alpha/beta hydrolase [Thalassotalea sp. LPB0316]QOL26442.1 alpha/beta hydrolase [Thalassotalea sp. LPB0316]